MRDPRSSGFSRIQASKASLLGIQWRSAFFQVLVPILRSSSSHAPQF